MAESHVAEHPPGLAHHFESVPQQREAAELGMWLFLVTEVMFFGGMFLAYAVYRWKFPAEFARGSSEMDLALGTINTGLLLTSSLTMALAVHAAQSLRRTTLLTMLAATMLLGAGFLGIKVVEYVHKYEHHLIPFAGLTPDFPQDRYAGMSAFFNLYFLMTGLHALHMAIGIGVLIALAIMAWRGGLLGNHSTIVFNVGLYWHFVDLIWVFLFPLFYLIGAHTHGGHP